MKKSYHYNIDFGSFKMKSYHYNTILGNNWNDVDATLFQNKLKSCWWNTISVKFLKLCYGSTILLIFSNKIVQT